MAILLKNADDNCQLLSIRLEDCHQGTEEEGVDLGGPFHGVARLARRHRD